MGIGTATFGLTGMIGSITEPANINPRSAASYVTDAVTPMLLIAGLGLLIPAFRAPPATRARSRVVAER
jgi:hypothetical protein